MMSYTVQTIYFLKAGDTHYTLTLLPHPSSASTHPLTRPLTPDSTRSTNPPPLPRARCPGEASGRFGAERCGSVSIVYISRQRLSNEYSTQRMVTPELFLSRDGELRDIQEEFSEYVRYCYGHLSKFSFFNLSPCPFSQSSFRTDS